MNAAEIKRRRIHLGMTQDDLALVFGVSRNTISRWELGTAQPEAPGMLKIAFDHLLAEHTLESMGEKLPHTEKVFFGLDANGNLDSKAVARAIKQRLKKLQQSKLELSQLIEQQLLALDEDEELTKRRRVRKQKPYSSF